MHLLTSRPFFWQTLPRQRGGQLVARLDLHFRVGTSPLSRWDLTSPSLIRRLEFRGPIFGIGDPGWWLVSPFHRFTPALGLGAGDTVQRWCRDHPLSPARRPRHRLAAPSSGHGNPLLEVGGRLLEGTPLRPPVQGSGTGTPFPSCLPHILEPPRPRDRLH